MTLPPLSGIRVLDFTQLLPGAHCGMVLADFGAQVIKVEPPSRGDPMRLVHPAREDGESGRHLVLNRGKRSLCANLKSPADSALVRRLACEADVILESFRPGVMKRLGLGYDDLRGANPGLIYVSLSGFGQTSARAGQPSHDINFLALSGYLDVATATGEIPSLPAVQIGDIGGGSLQAIIATLLALRTREQSGLGQHLDIAMYDGLMSLLSSSIADHNFAHTDPRPGAGRLTGGYACYRAYPCRDGRHIAVGALEAKFWTEFVSALGRPDLIEDHLDPGRQPELTQTLTQIFAGLTLDDALDLVGDNCCVSPVRTLDEALTDVDLWERGALIGGATPGVDAQPGTTPSLSDISTPSAAEPLDASRAAIERGGWSWTIT